MKIVQLDLLRFGPFTNHSLSFDGNGQGLHIVYGPNEAGKSSTLRALRQLLYGIPHNSPDDFQHRYADMRIGAIVESGAGERLEFIRRKGRDKTLREADDRAEFDTANLLKLLEGIDETAFRQRFALDHEELIRGGRDVAEGKGDLGQILFAAGAGITGLGDYQKRLVTQSESLFKQRGSTQEINKTLAELKLARDAIREHVLLSTEWSQHDSALRQAETRQSEIDRLLADAWQEKNRLSRLEQALPLIAQWRAIQRSLAPVQNAPRLPDDFPERRREALAKLDAATQQEQDALREIERLEAVLANCGEPSRLLEHAEAIAQLQEDLGSHRKAARDREERQTELRQLEQHARYLLRDLGREENLNAGEGLRVTRSQRRRIQELGNQRGELVKAVDAARDNVARLEQELDRAQSQKASRPQPHDAAELSRAIRVVQAQGNIEQRLTEARETLAKMERQARVDLQRLTLWTGSLAELECLAVPTSETVLRFENDMATATAERDRLRQAAKQIRFDLSHLDEQIEQQRLQQDVPTEEMLDTARQERDRGWRLVLSVWQQESVDQNELNEFVARWASGRDVAAAYQSSVEAADRLADRLRREANQVALKARRLADREQLVRRQLEADEAMKVVQQRWESLQQEWESHWQPIGVKPLPPREMQRWLQQQKTLVGAIAEIHQHERETIELETEVQQAVTLLSTALTNQEEPPQREGESLQELLERCRQVEQQWMREATVAEEITRTEQRLRKELELAIPAAERAQAQMERWREEWGEAVRAIQLAADAVPSEANDVLNAIQELDETLRTTATLTSRIEGIDNDAARFRETTARLVIAAAPDLADAPPEQAAGSLHQRLIDAERERTRQEQCAAQLEHHTERRDGARSAIESWRGVLARMCQEAGCDDVDSLRESEERSALRCKYEQTQQELEDRLHQLAAGLSLDEFATEASQIIIEELQPALVRLKAEIETLERERDEVNQTIGTERTELRRMDGSSQAAEGQERVEHLLATVRTHAEEYVRLRVAAAVLQRAIERFQASHQGPILQRASEFFHTLTCGSFDGLRVDGNDRGEPVLVGVRDEGARSVGVEGMSAGTCDQLYLALRLASLEQSLNDREPLPFVVDDILIRCDDRRSMAALEILAELSKTTQVILFTHHEHLVDLASQHLDDDVLLVHRLEGQGDLPSRRASGSLR